MKKSISLAAIAALFAAVSAFTGKYQVVQWNVDNPETNQPGIYFLTMTQIKSIYCPGLNNVECAYQIGNTSNIVKKP